MHLIYFKRKPGLFSKTLCYVDRWKSWLETAMSAYLVLRISYMLE